MIPDKPCHMVSLSSAQAQTEISAGNNPLGEVTVLSSKEDREASLTNLVSGEPVLALHSGSILTPH